MTRTWRKATDPPKANLEQWSRQVVAITNLSRVYKLCFMGGSDWQRPAAFKKGERVEYWIDFPCDW